MPHDRRASILLLSTSDTDLLAARASRAGYRLANPARLPLEDLPALVDGVDLVVVRLLGGEQAWREGLELLPPPAAAPGRARRRAGARRRPDGAVDGPRRHRRPGPPVPGLRRPGQPGRAGRLPGRHGPASRHRLRRPPGRPRPGGSAERPRGRDGPTVAVLYYRAHELAGNTGFVDTLCEAVEARGARPCRSGARSLRAADPDLLELLGRADALVVTVLAAGGTTPALAPGRRRRRGLGRRRRGRPRRPGRPGPLPDLVPRRLGGHRRRPEPAGRGHPGGHPGVRRPADQRALLVQGARRRRPVPVRPRPGAGRPGGRHGRRPGPAAARPPGRAAGRGGAVVVPDQARPDRQRRRPRHPGQRRPRCCGRCASAATTSTRPTRPTRCPGVEDGRRRRPDPRPDRGRRPGPRVARPTEQLAEAAVRIPAADYLRWYRRLPAELREAIEATWGPPPGELYVDRGLDPARELVLAALRAGNLVLLVQPPRGFGENPVAIYHDPAMPPSHHYLAAYRWLEQGFGAHAVVHLGKHGTLEWLPGKNLGMSAGCWPDAVLGDLPLIYPFLVNDPGEGTQAKRRAHATIVDHLVPPMTRAETYGDLARLEQLMDEHASVAALDPGKLPAVRAQIWTLIQAARLDHDLGLSVAAPRRRVRRLPAARRRLAVRGQGRPDPRRPARARGGPGRRPSGSGWSWPCSRPASSGPARRGRCRGCGRRSGWPRTARAPRAEVDRVEGQARAAGGGDGAGRLAGRRRPRRWSPRCSAAATRRWSGCSSSRPPSWSRGWRRPPASSTPCCTPWTAATCRPGRAGRRCGGWSTSCRPGATSTPSTPRRCRPGWPGRPASSWPTRCWTATGEETGDWPTSVGLSVWGTAAMRTPGDDVAEVLALLGVRPVWDEVSRRVTGLEVVGLAELGRPRIDVVVRISGFFRDAFPQLVTLLDDAVRLVAEPRRGPGGQPRRAPTPWPTWSATTTCAGRPRRIFGSPPGAYGAGLLPLMDSRSWRDDADLAEVYAVWGGHAYGRGLEGRPAREDMEHAYRRIAVAVKNTDTREHDIADSDDYYQYHGGMVATVRAPHRHRPRGLRRRQHPARARPRPAPCTRSRRGCSAPGWSTPAGSQAMRRHGYKGAFELAATVDYLFGWDATTGVVADWMYERLTAAYVLDPETREFLERSNPWALRGITERLLEAVDRGLWEAPEDATLQALRQAYLQVEGQLEEAHRMSGLPFPAVVGQDDARLALLLGAVDPGIGGVLLTGREGHRQDDPGPGPGRHPARDRRGRRLPLLLRPGRPRPGLPGRAAPAGQPGRAPPGAPGRAAPGGHRRPGHRQPGRAPGPGRRRHRGRVRARAAGRRPPRGPLRRRGQPAPRPPGRRAPGRRRHRHAPASSGRGSRCATPRGSCSSAP